MTRPNLPTLRSIAVDPALLINLPLDALDALLSEAEAENKIVSAAKRAVVTHLEAQYAKPISGMYDAKGSDYGAVRLSEFDYDIVVDTPKRVEWDQAKLAEVRERIQFSGDDPSEYIKTTLTVDERAYSAWPKHIRDTFEPARTTKPGTRSIKLVKKEAA